MSPMLDAKHIGTQALMRKNLDRGKTFVLCGLENMLQLLIVETVPVGTNILKKQAWVALGRNPPFAVSGPRVRVLTEFVGD